MDNSKCRLCLNQLGDMKDIFQHTIGCKESLSDFLYWVFRVEVDTLDPFSKSICSDCLARIQYVVNWRNKFQSNQLFLENSYAGKAADRSKEKTTKGNNKGSSSVVNNGTSKWQQKSLDQIVKNIDKMFETIDKNIPGDWSEFLYKKDAGTQTEGTFSRRVSSYKDYYKVHKNVLSTMAPRVVLTDFRRTPNNFKRISENTYKQIGHVPKQVTVPEETECVKVRIDALKLLCPQVYLEDFSSAIENEDFKQVDNITYRKQKRSSSKENSQKRWKYIDYYYNHRSYAIRELIARKEFRDCKSAKNDPIYDVTSTTVYVCEVCDMECNSKLELDIHSLKIHRLSRKIGQAKALCGNVFAHKSLNKKPTFKTRSKQRWCKKKMFREKIVRVFGQNKLLCSSEAHAVINIGSEDMNYPNKPHKFMSYKGLSNTHLSEVIKKLADRLTDEAKLD